MENCRCDPTNINEREIIMVCWPNLANMHPIFDDVGISLFFNANSGASLGSERYDSARNAKLFQTKLNFSTEHIAEQIDSQNVPSYHTSPAPAQTSSQVFFLCHQPMVSAIDNPTRSLLSIKMVSGTWATTDRLSTQIPKPTRSHRRHQFSKWLLRATSQAPG